MSFRLLLSAPYPEDGTSMYRAWGPITELRKIVPDLELLSFHTLGSNPSGTRFAWPEIQNVDAVFLQRPFQQEHAMMAKIAKTYKKPLWVDFDDDLQDVPECNPTHNLYNTAEVKRNLEVICKMADVITVTTKALGEKLSKWNQKILVVPNALNTRILSRLDGAIPRNKCILWRGSHCHFTDLFDHTKQIMAAYHEFPDWSWVFIGYNPTWITRDMDKQKRVRFVPFDNDYINYIGNLQKLRAAVQVIPLVEMPFNHAKSRVAHLEASLSGSAVLAPDWEEWSGGVIFRYSNANDFQEKLFHMLKTPLEDLAETNNKDWAWVESNRTLPAINEFRRGIIQAFRNQI